MCQRLLCLQVLALHSWHSAGERWCQAGIRVRAFLLVHTSWCERSWYQEMMALSVSFHFWVHFGLVHEVDAMGAGEPVGMPGVGEHSHCCWAAIQCSCLASRDVMAVTLHSVLCPIYLLLSFYQPVVKLISVVRNIHSISSSPPLFFFKVVGWQQPLCTVSWLSALHYKFTF